MEGLNFQWHLTRNCNLRCLHCYQESYSAAFPPGHLQDRAKRLLQDLEKRSVHTRINLTGGEPLLLGGDLVSLVSLLDSHPLVEELSLITNGTLLDHTWLGVLRKYSKLTTIKVSLEGGTESANDVIRGKGVFRRVLRALELLQQDGSFRTVVMFTVQRGNMQELQNMFGLIQAGNADGLILERFIPEGRGREMKESTLRREDWREITRAVAHWAGIDSHVMLLFPYRAYWLQEYPTREVMGATCDIGHSLCILDDGSAYPCRRFLLKLGNIFEDGLWEVYESADILRKVRTRSSLSGRCGTCTVANCFGCRALGYSLYRDPFAEDFHCPLGNEE